MSSPQATVPKPGDSSWGRKIADLIDLTKPRIVTLSLMMAALGYTLARTGREFDLVRFLSMWVGLALIGAGCGALNHFLEQDTDAKMTRTRNRPLPTGRLRGWEALALGFSTTFFGELTLLVGVNAITAVLGGLTFLFYLGVYTPAKRVSSLSTLVGAIPGAMPPLMGWTAGFGRVAPEGLLLFAILFLWQVPHFLAIAWMYRDDYRAAGFPILSVVDEDGIATAKQVVLYSIVLIPLSLVPSLWGITGQLYFMGSLILGLVFLAFGILLGLYRSRPHARRLFFASILYLPALGILMCWDRIF